LRGGYGVYPPYTQEEPNTGKVTGFSVDIIEEIGQQLNVKVIWRRINWNTMAADLKRGDFDVIADPIFMTIPRAREFGFSAPYAYFADGIAVIRYDEERIKSFDDLAQPGLRIAVGRGWSSEALMKAQFPNANLISVQTSTDLLQVFNEVVAGRADVAIADGADAERYVKEHPRKVKALWLDHPPAYVPGGFALRFGDRAGQEFLNVSLLNLEATGVLNALARKYGVTTLSRSAGKQP
jgi:polar amino acid transport system substrate-binding protein